MPYAFHLGPHSLQARPSGALFWPAQQLLCVSDLHLGKAERLARRGGGLLPPYETRDTLQRLADEIDATQARQVLCLGDSFDDLAAAQALSAQDRLWIARLMAGRSWHWVEGNHDPGPVDLGGSLHHELQMAGLVFRHQGGRDGFEISGHFHPKARLSGRQMRCFVTDGCRLLLPAFGAYTGGLDCADGAISSLFGAKALAILTGTRCRAIPMPR